MLAKHQWWHLKQVVLLLIQMNYYNNFLCFPPESATGSSLVSEDWALIMEICNMINSSEEGCVASNTTDFIFEKIKSCNIEMSLFPDPKMQ